MARPHLSLRDVALWWVDNPKRRPDPLTEAITTIELSPLLVELLSMLDYRDWARLRCASHTVRAILRAMGTNIRLNRPDTWSMTKWQSYPVARRFVRNVTMPKSVRMTVNLPPLSLTLTINERTEPRRVGDQWVSDKRYSAGLVIDCKEFMSNPSCLEPRAALTQILWSDPGLEWLLHRLEPILAFAPKLEYRTAQTALVIDGGRKIQIPDLSRVINFHVNWTMTPDRAVLLFYHWLSTLSRITELTINEGDHAHYGLDYLQAVLA